MLSNLYVHLLMVNLLIKCVVSSGTTENSTTNKKHYNDEKLQDLKILSELPMDKLLKVKSSLAEFSNDEVLPVTFKESKNVYDSPEALALSSYPDNPNRRTDLWSKKGKGGKINTLFMLSITTLAFLSFGGYLLCLIVQAIKGKGYQTYSGTTLGGTQPIMVMSGSIKKKKPQINYGKRKKRELIEGSDSDEMYDILIKLSESYAAWDRS